MKTLSATPRPYDCWKTETLSFLHVLLVWGVTPTCLLNTRRQSWTIHSKQTVDRILEWADKQLLNFLFAVKIATRIVMGMLLAVLLDSFLKPHFHK
jgi:hypothetical protein